MRRTLVQEEASMENTHSEEVDVGTQNKSDESEDHFFCVRRYNNKGQWYSQVFGLLEIVTHSPELVSEVQHCTALQCPSSAPLSAMVETYLPLSETGCLMLI